MRKSIKLVAILLVTVLVLNILIPSVNALTIKYNFTSNEESNIQSEDQFTYRNDCFERSSFLGCSHLEILSAQVAEASASWYGTGIDKHEVDYSNNAHNITEMLENMGFENVTTNKYYTLEKEENSAGVAVVSQLKSVPFISVKVAENNLAVVNNLDSYVSVLDKYIDLGKAVISTINDISRSDILEE